LYHVKNYSWTSSEEILDVAQRSPTVFRPNLNFLKKSALGDQSSASELAKFGFSLNSSTDCSKASLTASLSDNPAADHKVTDSLKFGSFVASPVIAAVPVDSQPSPHSFRLGEFTARIPEVWKANDYKPKFAGRNYLSNCLNGFKSHVSYWLECAIDLRQANYTEEEISAALNFFGRPPNELALTLLGRCSLCKLSGHTNSVCPDRNLGPNFRQNTGPLGILTDGSWSGPMRCCLN
jgi:hypothetical protein